MEIEPPPAISATTPPSPTFTVTEALDVLAEIEAVTVNTYVEAAVKE